MPSAASLDARAAHLRVLAGRVWRDPFARNSAAAMLVTVAGSALGYATQLLFARMLGPAGYGTYTYSTAWLNVVQLFAALDMGLVALRFTGYYTAAGSWGHLRGFLRRTRTLVVTAAATCTAVGVAAVYALGDRLGDQRAAALLAISPAVVPAALLALESNVLQGFHRTFGARVPTSLVRPLVFMAILAAALGAGRDLGARGALLANAAALWVAALLSVWWTERARPPESRAAPVATETGTWLRMAGGTLTGSVLQMLLSQQSDVIIAGSLLGAHDAGLYSAASQLASLVLFGVATTNQLSAPRLAAYGDDLGAPGFAAEVRRTSLINWALSLPLAAVFALGGPWILRAFGAEYAAAYPALCVMLVSQVVSATGGGLAGYVLNMVGYHGVATVVIGLSAALNLALTAVLTPRYGIVGTAWASTIAMAARAVAMQVVVRRATGIWVLPGRVPRARGRPGA